jgi:hypothetical protein
MKTHYHAQWKLWSVAPYSLKTMDKLMRLELGLRRLSSTGCDATCFKRSCTQPWFCSEDLKSESRRDTDEGQTFHEVPFWKDSVVTSWWTFVRSVLFFDISSWLKCFTYSIHSYSILNLCPQRRLKIPSRTTCVEFYVIGRLKLARHVWVNPYLKCILTISIKPQLTKSNQ